MKCGNLSYVRLSELLMHLKFSMDFKQGSFCSAGYLLHSFYYSINSDVCYYYCYLYGRRIVTQSYYCMHCGDLRKNPERQRYRKLRCRHYKTNSSFCVISFKLLFCEYLSQSKGIFIQHKSEYHIFVANIQWYHKRSSIF
jgi:hypothetical protein